MTWQINSLLPLAFFSIDLPIYEIIKSLPYIRIIYPHRYIVEIQIPITALLIRGGKFCYSIQCLTPS